MQSLRVDDRLAIANMTTEWGALSGLFPMDGVLKSWMEQKASEHESRLSANHPRLNAERIGELFSKNVLEAHPEAVYAKTLSLDLLTLSPFVAGPNSVKIATPLPELEKQNIAIQKAYLVSCTNSRASDIGSAAAVFRAQGPDAKADLAVLWAKAGDGSMPIAVGFDIAIAMPLSWLPLIADYSRFGKRANSVFGGTALGFFIGNFWLMGLGVAYTLAFAPSGEVNALLLALAGAGLGIPLLLILLDESENAFADIHSAAVSSGILLRLKVEHLALAIGVICTLIACFAPLAQYQNFLLLIGSVFAPLFGVVLVDHFILRHRRAGAVASLRWPALVAWLGGIATYHLLANLYPDVGATLPALVLAGLLQLILGRAFSGARAPVQV